MISRIQQSNYHNKTIGNISEEFVSKYIENNGYNVLQRNFVIRGGEIDIICKKSNEIVFFEVKSLTKNSPIILEQTITRRKCKTLIRTCQIWLKENHLENAQWRIDFIGVIIEGYDKIIQLKHIPNAIY